MNYYMKKKRWVWCHLIHFSCDVMRLSCLWMEQSGYWLEHTQMPHVSLLYIPNNGKSGIFSQYFIFTTTHVDMFIHLTSWLWKCWHGGRALNSVDNTSTHSLYEMEAPVGPAAGDGELHCWEATALSIWGSCSDCRHADTAAAWLWPYTIMERHLQRNKTANVNDRWQMQTVCSLCVLI